MKRTLGWMMLLAAAALTACGGASSNSASSTTAVSASSSSGAGTLTNVLSVTVGPGPTQASSSFNTPSATIKVCVHGSSTSCQTISNVLIDTGSFGLRLLASALNGLPLDYQTDPNAPSNLIAECQVFADGYTWGPVASVDLTMGGESISGLPVNVIDDLGTLVPTAPSSCATPAMNVNSGTLDALGANGVLGVGIFSYDCGGYCAQPASSQTSGYVYYSCNPGTGACAGASETLASQVINPVAMLTKDNNGVILELPSVAAGGANTATGTLVFGIGTESNNALGSATVLTMDPSAIAFQTTFNGQTLSSGFIDSGSNALFFVNSSIPQCSDSNLSGFYCPSSTLMLSATNQGTNGNTAPAQFQIANLATLNGYALDDVGGSLPSTDSLSDYFDFGLPFFYGRSVFTSIVDPDGNTAPYWAY